MTTLFSYLFIFSTFYVGVGKWLIGLEETAIHQVELPTSCDRLLRVFRYAVHAGSIVAVARERWRAVMT